MVNAFALWIYQKGGIVRDIPELGIREGETDPMIFERYTDRIYQYDHEFTEDDNKKKVLIIGNSFARDFANVLLESPMGDSNQLSYHYSFSDCPLSRIRHCDRIFFFGWKHDVPDAVWQTLRQGAEIWGIGTDYYSQRASIRQSFFAVNRLLREEWQDRYVDFLSLAAQFDGRVPVFTPSHEFITYDGSHLTPFGASYYADELLSISLWQ